jgi:hypothetical protein
MLFVRLRFCEASAPEISMAKRRTTRSTFWFGALCGAAAAFIARQMLTLGRPHLTVIRGKGREKAEVFRIPLRRDAGGGDPSTLASDRSRARPGFERSGGAPGGVAAAEVHDVPGHPGQRLDYTDAAQPVRSSRMPHPPRHPSKG